MLGSKTGSDRLECLLIQRRDFLTILVTSPRLDFPGGREQNSRGSLLPCLGVSFPVFKSANRIDELYYKGMRLRVEETTQQREKAPKVVLAGHKEEGKKKDTEEADWETNKSPAVRHKLYGVLLS